MTRSSDRFASPTDSAAPSLQSQAIHWWVLLHSEDATAADHREFGAWIARSPEHIASYLNVGRLLLGLKSKSVVWPHTPAETLIREAQLDRALEAQVKVVSLASRLSSGPQLVRDHCTMPESARSNRRIARWVGGVAAMAVVALAVVLWPFTQPNPTYQTQLGEQRSVLLDDGSRITLNTNSAVEVEYSHDLRLVHLPKGEALFEVSRDEHRPFEVQIGEVKLRALGTQFNVDRRSDRTAVTVVEGRVALVPSSARASDRAPVGSNALGDLDTVLAAADRVVIAANGERSFSQLERPEVATAWLRRQYVFRDRPLREVAAELNRYNHDRILIEGDVLAQQSVTGVIQLNDPGAFVAFVSGIPEVRSTRSRDGTYVISSAPPVEAFH